MHRARLARLLPVLAAAAIGCGGGGKPPPPAPRSGGPGLGASTAAPTGTPFAPAGVTFGTLSGDVFTDCEGAAQEGYGWYVQLCLPMTAETPSFVELPAGLVFVSESTETQNGVLLQPVEVAVSGTTTVQLSAFCVNAGRDGSGAGDTYSVGPDTDSPGLNELVALLADKALGGTIAAGSMPAGAQSYSGTAYAAYEGGPVIELVQDLVWSVTDGGGLTASDRQAIAALP